MLLFEWEAPFNRAETAKLVGFDRFVSAVLERDGVLVADDE